MEKLYIAYFDGASKGNPGPAGIGGVILDGSKVLMEIKKYIGTATNNQAEYSALIEILEKARESGIENLSIFSDSELVVRQLSGEYQVKDPKLKPLYDQVQSFRPLFLKLTFQHVSRLQNKHADALANQAVFEAEGKDPWVELDLKSEFFIDFIEKIMRELQKKDNLSVKFLSEMGERFDLSEKKISPRFRLKRNGNIIQIEW